MNTSAAFAVGDASGVAVARRAALLAADRLGFAEQPSGRVALIVSELASNLAKHARGGEILIRPLENAADLPGLEILAIDKGPGIADLASSRRDGHSTSGTLGHGLGAIERQSDLFEMFTQPTGTVVLARVWRDGASAGHPPVGGPQWGGRSAAVTGRVEAGAVLVSMPGEEVCGDGAAWGLRPDRAAVFVVDGLGHGLQAHDAARRAVIEFERVQGHAPARVIEEIHGALRETRGGAVAMIAIDLERGTARYAGVGNIAGAIVIPSGARHGLVSMHGTAGHVIPRIQEFTYPVASGALVILHSDGISSQWDLNAYPGLRDRHPSITAAVLYRDFSRRRDDVSIVVLRERS